MKKIRLYFSTRKFDLTFKVLKKKVVLQYMKIDL